MKIATPGRPMRPAMAAAPVSPEVAPRTFTAPPRALPRVEAAEQLEGDVLEGERRPVEELQHAQAGVELEERRDLGALEAEVGPRGELPELRLGYVVRETAQEAEAELGVLQPLEAPELLREVRKLLRHEEPAVTRQALRDSVREPERGAPAACRDVAHARRALGLA